THAARHVQNHGAAAEYPKTIAITAQQEWLTAWHLDVQRLELFGRRQTRWRQRLVARRRSSTRVSRSLGTHAASSHFMQLAACTMWSTMVRSFARFLPELMLQGIATLWKMAFTE